MGYRTQAVCNAFGRYFIQSCANETVIFQVLQKQNSEQFWCTFTKIETDYIKRKKKQILCGGMEALPLIFMFWNLTFLFDLVKGRVLLLLTGKEYSSKILCYM